ncbi:MAG: LysR family transcriptional regulator [Coxiellaceae bacterium]|nr:LysR family transcriptional regulator [Coxiellaceae bacterium]
MMNQIILSQIDAFLAIVETGSFTQAANKLCMSKSAISQSLQALENNLKIILLIRTTRKIVLTEEGKLFLNQCKRLKEELNTTNDFAKQLHEKPSGTLRISCNVSVRPTTLGHRA